MAKRFGRYKFALAVTDGQAPVGTPLEKYKKYKAGEIKPTYTSNPASNPGTLKQIYLSPFATAPGAKYSAQMSERAFNKMADLVSLVPKTLFHHLDQGATNDITVNPGYSPAKATVNISGTGSTNEISKITGVTYKKETGSASYTVAFGGQLSAGDERFFINVVQNIIGAVKNKNSEYTVSFTPEQFRLQ